MMNKRPFIFTSFVKGFHMLWIGRISFVVSTHIYDPWLIGLWVVPSAVMLHIGKLGIGIGHSFGFENEAYRRSSDGEKV
jgi:hypothetical protein